ncbi:hypothetical protein ACFOSC_08430 [Streptantibioticus rubrisoli]|jgi:hypothetical protein|uniref:Uncharacterized protein n=1 Tax=Streptantibioticus rubrisoli TaxID=1387313 RepID=A0ABT1PAW3_9ACTN|nr:hypothetical protein [Streptantibioticus rubrisoli]MCQ4041383.1 hypothetical protein [Streptantibioticus rubrisoli]
MRHRRLGLGAVLGSGVIVAASLVAAPLAGAVSPDTATLSFDCGSYGSGTATLTASQDGSTATITVSTSAITAPIDISAGSVSSTLTLTDSNSQTVTLTGSSNPDISAGSAVSTGPLTGTVPTGDGLQASSLQVTVFGITATCNATSAQDPGPFVF